MTIYLYRVEMVLRNHLPLAAWRQQIDHKPNSDLQMLKTNILTVIMIRQPYQKCN